MNREFTIRKANSCKMGVSLTDSGICVNAVLSGKETNGMIIYDSETKEECKIDFPENCRIGRVYQCILNDLDIRNKSYMLHEDGKPVTDEYAKALNGHFLFGNKHVETEEDEISACLFVSDDFDWKGDKKPGTAYEDSIYYGLHVRGFTMDASSKVKEAGTFAGVVRKIPYLKKLGITGVVLQPVYEFNEYQTSKLNYWGYQKGYYMAPKNAYSYTRDAVTELKTLVRELHANNIEVFLQFYFDAKMSSGEARDILCYWEQSYHIDGFHIIGNNELANELARDPYLAEAKIWCEGFTDEVQEIDKTSEKINRRLAVYNRDYMYDCRRFLKGDSETLSAFLMRHRENDYAHGTIKFMSSYDGFRMMDMVSYNEKHNEANGENNRDGDAYNCSWNCGEEGATNKKSVIQLRKKQLRNALVMLFTSQGTPFIFMGDEWGRTSLGNNNPYGQDNELNYLNWNLKKAQKELLGFTIRMIAIRKQYDVFRQSKPLRIMDYISCGYPDLSYHGKEPWRPQLGNSAREIGIMLCGKYSASDAYKNSHLYIMFNMHWKEHEFALPKLEKGLEWSVLLDTEEANEKDAATIAARSVRIYITEKEK